MFKFIKRLKQKNIIIFADLISLISDKKKFNNTIKETEKIIKELIKNENTIVLPTYNLNFPKLKITGYSEKFITTGSMIKYLLNIIHVLNIMPAFIYACLCIIVYLYMFI